MALTKEVVERERGSMSEAPAAFYYTSKELMILCCSCNSNGLS
jgi:hypothetical protein